MKRRSANPASIQLLILDVDGVLTDGRLYYGTRGETLKAFHVRDGYGIKALRKSGVEIAVISGRDSAMVSFRCKELGIRKVFQGVHDKLAALNRLCKQMELTPLQCACIGDDSPDVSIMQVVGLAFAVADAHPEARSAAHRVTTLSGGLGAVREVCDLLVAARGAP